MNLIADSGSTSTQWCFIENNKIIKKYDTEGINPFYQNEDDIVQMLKANDDFISYHQPDAIFFYGAGCINQDKNNIVKSALLKCFNSNEVFIASDLLAAARATCGHQKGIACILGTGSNSCYYDGNSIVENVSPLGFILGDEGSGAVLGKRLIGDILKNQLPDSIVKDFENTYSLQPVEILNKVYREPFPNRFLSQFTRFLKKHELDDSIQKLITYEFQLFVSRNINSYSNAINLPIHFVGSVAYHLSHLLKKAVDKNGLKIGEILQSPMEGLVRYHNDINYNT